jgi:hypothetical protein
MISEVGEALFCLFFKTQPLIVLVHAFMALFVAAKEEKRKGRRAQARGSQSQSVWKDTFFALSAQRV